MMNFALPAGYRFRPTDEELVAFFLYNKAIGGNDHQMFANDVRECDLYGIKEPVEIWEEFGGFGLDHQGEVDLYFFTRLKTATSKGSRIARKVGKGTWSGDNSETICAKGTKKAIGVKRNFSYENSESVEHKAWLMHEYSTNDCYNNGDWVLCRLRIKSDRDELIIKNTKRLSMLKRKVDDHDQEAGREGGQDHLVKKSRTSDQGGRQDHVIKKSRKPTAEMESNYPSPMSHAVPATQDEDDEDMDNWFSENVSLETCLDDLDNWFYEQNQSHLQSVYRASSEVQAVDIVLQR